MTILLLKQTAWQAIRQHEADLRDLALRILSNPEVGYQEDKASAWLATYLEQQGFRVTKPLGGLLTAFMACRFTGSGPTVAFLAEYDALPEIGHGCGHNLIAAACVGAGVGVATVLAETAGRVCVMGTPAEEFANQEEGKVTLLKVGAFEGIDVCLSMHPPSVWSAATWASSASSWFFTVAPPMLPPTPGMVPMLSMLSF